MKMARLMLALIMLAGAAASDGAFADRGRSGRGQFAKPPGFARPGHFIKHQRARVFVGVPILAPLFVPLPYTPPLPAVPTVYIERGSAPEEQAQEPAYWYYCRESQAYYPYVSECPGGWEQVAPPAR